MTATLELVQDQLNGIHTHHSFRQVERPAPYDYNTDPERQPVIIPYAVLIWDDGLDYNPDGTSYQDDWPTWFLHSAHNTRKGAEIEAAYVIDQFPSNKVAIESYWVAEQWELENHPIQD